MTTFIMSRYDLQGVRVKGQTQEAEEVKKPGGGANLQVMKSGTGLR